MKKVRRSKISLIEASRGTSGHLEGAIPPNALWEVIVWTSPCPGFLPFSILRPTVS